MTLAGPGLHVVGIGASAGGLDALERLFSACKPPTGMAFVVLQHLSPDFESRMDELLRRQTSMQVQVVQDGIPVEPDNVYLIPPKKEMIIAEGRLRLTTKDPARGLALPIDHFLRSLANDLGDRSIAVILSGSGSDGSRGVIEVAEAGGLVLCQAPDTARFESMPRSTLGTGTVHLELTPEHIPRVLARYVHSDLDPEQVSEEFAAQTPKGIRELFELLRRNFGIDFADYKPTTVERRVERRIAFRRADNLQSYVDSLREDPAELDRLYCDLLIGVTQFFRDPPVFRLLAREILPSLFDAAVEHGEELRVWVSGCATGEEAYSIAILLREEAQRRSKSPPLRVFATDVHRASLEYASVGRYSEASLANVSAERRAQWFTRVDDSTFQISSELRRLIVFAPHNAIVDAPFTRIDLISCRNLLIYLQPAAQRKALSLVHFGLRVGGVLLLGSSESPGELDDHFTPVDVRWRVYRKTDTTPIAAKLRAPRTWRTGAPPSTRNRTAGGAGLPDPRLGEVYDVLLRRYMPPALLIDSDYQLMHSFGGAERHVRLPGGRPSGNILDLVDPALKTTVYGALQHAEKQGRSVRYLAAKDAGDEIDADEVRYDIHVEPVNEIRSGFAGYLLQLEPVEREVPEITDTVETVDTDRLSSEYIASLEDELRYTRENLQATVEELQASNEELQASNEELQASNEELQSTNEELHSVNEELYTVNAQYQRKIDELSQVNADIDNLLHASEFAVVFLDAELRIRRFTRRAGELFGLLEHDIGREFAGFALRVEDADLLADARRAISEGARVTREVRDREGQRHVLRILPYSIDDSEGRQSPAVLVNLIEIEELKQSEDRVRRLSSIVESSEDVIASQLPDGSIATWNAGAEHLLGWEADEVLGRRFSDFVDEDLRKDYIAAEQAVQHGGELRNFDTTLLRRNGEPVEVAVTISPVLDDGGLSGTSVIARDIRDRNRAQARVREAVQQRETFIAMLSHELRNPLAALLHASRVVDEDIDADARAAANEAIRRQVGHMARLLDDLLDVSRIRRGKIEMRPERLRVGPLIERVREATASLMQNAGLELELEISDPELVVVADPDRLRQVLVNLLSNAAKFSPQGRSVSLRVGPESGSGSEDRRPRLVIAVADQGVGLRAHELDDIFEPFVQGHDVHTRERGGLGLGLALVRSIVEAHDGSIEARSDGPKRGSEFIVRLPLSSAQAEQDGAGPTAPGSVAASSGLRPRAVGRSLVLVEDDDDGRLMLAALLRAHGFEVTEAADGPAGLATILELAPDIALVDLGLPRMSGIEVGRRARERFATDELRLIALTGHGQQSDRRAVFDAGFDHHLVKPVDTGALEAVLLGEG